MPRERRNPRGASAYRRGGPVREPYDVVLIVCEGRKTEPNYVDGLRLAHGLSNVNVRVLQPPGQDPMSLANFAIQQMDRDREYDRGYCVFDRDGHAGFDDAVRTICGSTHGRAGKLVPITSVPCFALWVLLHYRYSAAPYVARGGYSACDRVIRDIQTYYRGYTKGSTTVFADLAPHIDRALDHAACLERHNQSAASWNPSTHMHHLVQYLRNLKRPKTPLSRRHILRT
jgi:hypothetical protein